MGATRPGLKQLVRYELVPGKGGWFLDRAFTSGRRECVLFALRKRIALNAARSLCRKRASFRQTAVLRIFDHEKALLREHWYDYPRGSDGRRPRRA